MSAHLDDRTHNFCAIKSHFVRSKCVFIKLQYYGRRFSENFARSRSSNKQICPIICIFARSNDWWSALQMTLGERFPGIIFSDVCDSHIKIFPFSEHLITIFSLISLFCVQVRWNIHYVLVFRYENRSISVFRKIGTPLYSCIYITQYIQYDF